jgi:branched-subunit amino acid permease
MNSIDRVATRSPIVVMLALALSGCRAIEGLFKAGVWVGVVIAVALMLVVGAIFALARRT